MEYSFAKRKLESFCERNGLYNIGDIVENATGKTFFATLIEYDHYSLKLWYEEWDGAPYYAISLSFRYENDLKNFCGKFWTAPYYDESYWMQSNTLPDEKNVRYQKGEGNLKEFHISLYRKDSSFNEDQFLKDFFGSEPISKALKKTYWCNADPGEWTYSSVAEGHEEVWKYYWPDGRIKKGLKNVLFGDILIGYASEPNSAIEAIGYLSGREQSGVRFFKTFQLKNPVSLDDVCRLINSNGAPVQTSMGKLKHVNPLKVMGLILKKNPEVSFKNSNAFDLQKIYNQAIADHASPFAQWYDNYETTVKSFVECGRSGSWGPDDLKKLLQERSNGIASFGQGAMDEKSRDAIEQAWNSEFAPLIQDLCRINPSDKLSIEKKCAEIRILFEKKSTKKFKVVFNRALAAFLPDVVSSAVNDDDFYDMVTELKRRVSDYPVVSSDKNWVKDNIAFVEYCKQHVAFNPPWHSANFAWYLKELFEKDKPPKKLEGENDNEDDGDDDEDEVMDMEDMQTTDYSKNMILYGPPGTGKTYNTMAYAVAICTKTDVELVKQRMSSDYKSVKKEYDELVDKGRVSFVTFHQSYGYEDFIEGIRPVVAESSKSLGYCIEDGSFKEFCQSAFPQGNAFEQFEIAWDKLIDEIENVAEKTLAIPYVFKKGKSFPLVRNETKTGLKEKDKPRYFNKSQLYNIYRGLPGVAKGGHDSYRKAIVQYMKDHCGLQDYVQQDVSISEKDPYVFIIDEINRGNISKIFGELITLIEESKRVGCMEEMKATLPCSGNEFGVPDNVYIIGTMNTADRSIAMMDTALRRRFDFIEMMPDSSLLKEPINGIELDKMLNAINSRIEYLYDREHTIGHAFFIGVKTFDGLKDVFKDKVIPLLQEYFYDDYEKIRLVLGDNGKELKDYQFVTKTSKAPDKVFMANSSEFKDSFENLPEIKSVYEVNYKSLDCVESYVGIYSK